MNPQDLSLVTGNLSLAIWQSCASEPNPQSPVTSYKLQVTPFGGSWSHRLLPPIVALVVTALPHSLLACAACFGQSDDSMARGMNMGIFTLLVVIGSVLVGFASFGVFLARRSA